MTKPVVFPPRCVVCEAKNPDGLIALSFLGATTTPLFEVASDNLVGTDVARVHSTNTNNKIDGTPACKGCASGLKRYHFLLKFAMYTAWIPGLILLVVLKAPTFVKVMILLAFVLAPPLYSILFPPSFGATFVNDKATFEFKSKMVADEFRQLNAVSE